MEQLPLRDIHLPAPIGWWPPAPGWWLLLILATLLAAAGLWWFRRRRRTTPQKLALMELDYLRSDMDMLAEEKLRRLGILLRRVSLSLHPREQVAGLTGEAWLRWLDEGVGAPRFSNGIGRRLVDGPYRAHSPGGMDELLALCRDWVKATEKTRNARRP